MAAHDVPLVCPAAALPPPGGCVKVGEGVGAVAVFNVDGRFHAVQDLCTHDCSSLSEEGWLEDGVIECGWHLARFDVRTGAVLSPPARDPLRVFDVVVDGDHARIVERGR